MTERNRRAAQLFWLYSPALVCLALMLPRLLFPQFGLFDDGLMIGRARLLSQGEWALGEDFAAGRFRPMYWLYSPFLRDPRSLVAA